MKILQKKKNKLILSVAFNYSSKDELINAFKKIIKNNKHKSLTEKILNNYLYTADTPNPDILIRTGGHNRLSNFFLWQLSYSELFFIKKLWPDFSKKDLSSICKKYLTIKRNFGSI